jgi:hypothetical protein
MKHWEFLTLHLFRSLMVKRTEYSTARYSPKPSAYLFQRVAPRSRALQRLRQKPKALATYSHSKTAQPWQSSLEMRSGSELDFPMVTMTKTDSPKHPVNQLAYRWQQD